MRVDYSNDCWYKDVCSGYMSDCANACIRYREMSFLMEHSNIPKNRQFPQVMRAPSCDYRAYCDLAYIKDNIEGFVENGDNLYITSRSTGNGKTTWAIKLMLKYFDVVWAGNGFNERGLFIHVPTFLLKCKDFKNTDDEFENIKKLLPDIDLVIWDDIASTDISAYDYSQLLMFIDIRISNKLANIFTGNLVSRESLDKALGAKLTSRIWSDDTTVITFEGGDMR